MTLAVFCRDIEYSDVLHQKDYYDTSMQGNILSLSIVLFLHYKRYYYLVLLLMLMEYMVIR
jgi:hypothetical protein